MSPQSSVIRVAVRVEGIVQGVGFRPFVARLARRLGLSGHVENTTRGVEIEVQGSSEACAAFREGLRAEAPPVARILGLEWMTLPARAGEGAFEIRSSRADPISAAVIPPDIATCRQCKAELFDPGDRRAGYAFLNCTDCGPRYTIIGSVPYDRERTSMAAFRQCPACEREYLDPESRRFHAQPNACPACGPSLRALAPDGTPFPEEPLTAAVSVLERGGIIALLGVGGFHLACDAEDEEAVSRLRARKARPAKPFAVMVPDLVWARQLAALDADTEALLASPAAPIVLVPALGTGSLAPSVAPGQERVGLFLPYSPLHHLLFRRGGFRALVMTSGNRSDEPILATEEEARAKLASVADLLLVHDRPILHRIDDSVVKAMSHGPTVLRRARGYAPAPLRVANPSGKVLLAVGAELANAVAVVRGEYAYLGPHCGDLKGPEVEDAFRLGVDHLLGLLRVSPEAVVCDLHPGYRSTAYAEEWEARGVPLLRVQHHEAHAAACMAENGFRGEGLAIVLDGLGYGSDGTLWGGELLAGRPGGFTRVGHLVPVPQPGGDRAALEPWRMAASHLRAIHGPRWIDLPLACFRERPRKHLEILEEMMARALRSPLTSSCGRLFDAAAALLGFTGPLRYSAQAAMELEGLAARAAGPAPAYPVAEPRRQGEMLLLDASSTLKALAEDALAGRPPGAAALGFHAALARLLARGIEEASGACGLGNVFLSGGCFQNDVLLRHLTRELAPSPLRLHFHREVPPNDGGIAFGQAAWAAAALNPTP